MASLSPINSDSLEIMQQYTKDSLISLRPAMLQVIENYYIRISRMSADSAALWDQFFKDLPSNSIKLSLSWIVKMFSRCAFILALREYCDNLSCCSSRYSPCLSPKTPQIISKSLRKGCMIKSTTASGVLVFHSLPSSDFFIFEALWDTIFLEYAISNAWIVKIFTIVQMLCTINALIGLFRVPWKPLLLLPL